MNFLCRLLFLIPFCSIDTLIRVYRLSSRQIKVTGVLDAMVHMYKVIGDGTRADSYQRASSVLRSLPRRYPIKLPRNHEERGIGNAVVLYPLNHDIAFPLQTLSVQHEKYAMASS